FGTITDGNSGANYSLSFVNATGAIVPRALLITATAANKTYDGSTSTIVTFVDNRVLGDHLTESYSSAAFADKNVGTAKLVTVNGVSLSGPDANNYSFNATATATAGITPA